MAKLIPIDVSVSGSSINNAVIDGVTLVYSVDGTPTANISLHEIPAAGTSYSSTENKRVFATEEAAKMQKFQESAFAGAADLVDLTINPFNHIYSGSILGPQRTIFTGYYNNGVQLVHGLEKINGYLPHIYALTQIPTNSGDELAGADYTNVFLMVKTLLEKRHKDFEAAIEVAQFKDPTSKENALQIHRNNLVVFPAIAKICDDSSAFGGDTYLAFSDLPKTAKQQLNTSIFNVLRMYLFSSNLQFFNTLIQIGNAFQCYYVPPISGDSEYGYFRSNRNKVDDSLAELASLEITGANFASAQIDNRPIQQVIVTGQPPNLTNDNEAGSDNIYEFLGDNSTYLVFPEESPAENGNNVPLPIPEWIPIHLYAHTGNPATEHSRDLDLPKRKQQKLKLARSVRNELAGPISNVIKEYAETAYKTLALSSYTAVINCTLDFTLIPGKLYIINDEDFQPLFTGFLTSATHKISGISTSLLAGTTLVFNAVKFNNFQLPS